MSLTLTYDATLSRVRASATGLVDADAATYVGAFLEGASLGTSGWTASAAAWQAITGIPLSAGRWYAGTTYTIGTTLNEMIAAGVRICIDFAPPYNPVSSTDRDSIAAMLATMRAAGADVRVSLWHEPFLNGLTAAQYVAMIQYYGPTVRQYYPLWSVFSQNDTVEANGYFPGTSWVDGIAADCYAPNTANLDNCAAMADAHGLPLGLWEFNAAFDLGIDPSPVTGVTNAQAVTFFTYIKDLFAARIAAGKPNGDLLFFSSKASSTGTGNFLGQFASPAGGFQGGIGNWVAGTGTTVAQSTAQAHSGTASLALTCTTAGTISASHCLTANVTTQGMPIAAGQTAAFSCWFRPDTTARFAQPGVLFYNSGGTFLSTSFATAVSETTGAWTFVSGTAVAPANAAFAKFSPQITTVALSEIHYIDDPQISVLPASTDHTAPVQYPWDFRITPLASIQTALNGTGTAGGLYRLQRSTDQVRWITVRGGTAIASSGGAVALDDYEFAADVANFYQLLYADRSIVVPGGTANITPSLGGAVWVKSIARPFLNRAVTIVDFSPVRRRARAGVFDVAGRSAPVAVNDVRGSKQFDLQVLAGDLAAARDFDLVLASGDPLFVHVPAAVAVAVPGGYVTVGDTDEQRPGRRSVRRVFTLPCTVVAAPGPEVVGVTYTCQGVLNDFATCSALLAAFATCADLLDNVGSAEDVIVP